MQKKRKKKKGNRDLQIIGVVNQMWAKEIKTIQKNIVKYRKIQKKYRKIQKKQKYRKYRKKIN